MKSETEKNYLRSNEQIDDVDMWNSGTMYTVGLHDDGSESDVMVSTPSGSATNWADVFKTAIPAVASLYQQQQLTKLNIARMNSNQRPLTAQEYASVYQPPAAQVRVGATSDTKNLLMYAALGVAALVGLRAFKVI